MGLDSTRLCWCVRTASAAIVSKLQSHCRVFVSLIGLDWTRLESAGVYALLGRPLSVSYRVTAACSCVLLDWIELDSILLLCTHTEEPFCDLPCVNCVFNNMVSTLVSVGNTVYLDTIKAESLKLSIWDNTELCSLTLRHRASSILGQAFHYSPENIFNQQIYFII